MRFTVVLSLHTKKKNTMATGNDNSCTVPEFPWFWPPHSLVPRPLFPTQVTKTSLGERGKWHCMCVCACMRACIHTAIIPSGASAGPREQYIPQCGQDRGEMEGEFKQLQGLQCKSQKNMFRSGSTAVPPIHTYIQTVWQKKPQHTPPHRVFFSTYYALQVTECNKKASCDCIILS